MIYAILRILNTAESRLEDWGALGVADIGLKFFFMGFNVAKIIEESTHEVLEHTSFGGTRIERGELCGSPNFRFTNAFSCFY